MSPSELGVTCSTEATEVLLGAVRAGMAVLRTAAARQADTATRYPPDPRRIGAYLDAVADCCADAPSGPAPADAIVAVRTACDHVRVRELADAYLALEAARTMLATALGLVDEGRRASPAGSPAIPVRSARQPSSPGASPDSTPDAAVS